MLNVKLLVNFFSQEHVRLHINYLQFYEFSFTIKDSSLQRNLLVK